MFSGWKTYLGGAVLVSVGLWQIAHQQPDTGAEHVAQGFAIIGARHAYGRAHLQEKPMWPKGFEIAGKVVQAIALGVTLVEAKHDGKEVESAQKKQDAIQLIDSMLVGIVPAWLKGGLDSLLGVLVDLAVSWANSSGFFTKSAAA